MPRAAFYLVLLVGIGITAGAVCCAGEPLPEDASLAASAQELVSEKKYDQAIVLYTQLLESFPDNIPLHYLRALLNHQLGRLEQACQDYEFLVAENSTNASICNNLAAICAQNQQYQRALELLGEAAQQQPGCPQIHANLAQIYSQQKNYDLARAHWEKVLALDPEDQEAKNALAYLNSKR